MVVKLVALRFSLFEPGLGVKTFRDGKGAVASPNLTKTWLPETRVSIRRNMFSLCDDGGDTLSADENVRWTWGQREGRK